MKSKIIFLILVFGLLFLNYNNQALASVSDNVSGYAWSENIGWINFNGSSYGVNINTDGIFSGYAWSENIGWINFAPIGAYPSTPNYSAKVDISTGEISGWVRVCSVFETGCSGVLTSSDKRGGWDGWIKTRGTNYGVSINTTNKEFSGYAWSDMVIGWINFKGVNYGVKTTFPFVPPNDPPNKPDHNEEVQSNCAWESSPQVAPGTTVTFSWTADDPDGDQIEGYEIWVDESAGFSGHYFNHVVAAEASSYAFDLTQDDDSDWLTELQWNTTYNWKVRVTDKLGDPTHWSAWSNPDVFKTPQNAYPYPQFSWLPVSPNQKEVVVFTPNETNLDYLWTINETTGTGYEFVDGTDIDHENPHIVFETKNNTAKLKVIDGSYWCESEEKDIEAQLPLPEYKEVPPIIWLKTVVSALASLIHGFYIFWKF